MRIINETSCTIYVEVTGIMRRGLSLDPINAGENKTVFDAVIQRIYSDHGTCLIVSDKQTEIKTFGELKAEVAPEEKYGKNVIIIRDNED